MKAPLISLGAIALLHKLVVHGFMRKGKLEMARDHFLKYHTGVLSAATAFGKTAVGAAMIAARKVNTLILVHNREIMKNWLEDLQKFLIIDEKLPTYTTPTGRIKQ